MTVSMKARGIPSFCRVVGLIYKYLLIYCRDTALMMRPILLYPLIFIVVSLLIFTSWSIDERGIRASALDIIRLQGESVFQLLEVMRIWNENTGVYTLASPSIDPYKSTSAVIGVNGQAFYRLNSAHMTKDIGELLSEQGTQVIFSSLKLLNPANAPDEWTTKALLDFEAGSTASVDAYDDEYRYLAPLKIREACMECHQHQGYQVGDIRGGLGFIFSKEKVEGILEQLQHHSGRSHLIAAIVLSATFMLLHYIVSQFNTRLTEAKKDNKELTEKVNRDLLTGVLSRDAIFHRIQHELSLYTRRNSSFALMMLDLDHFKKVNDTYGHLVGDEMLQAISDLVMSQLRDIDDMGRYGGEEFIIILTDVSIEGVKIVSERILKAVDSSKVCVSTGDIIPITISIGVTIAAYDDDITVKELINQADEALYRAKNDGRNCVRYHA